MSSDQWHIDMSMATGQSPYVIWKARRLPELS